ncbi:E3 ubiquitin ligase family protein [Candidatus Micrarchaeota archaeon]|nr:E3 ubiquitin ligase family protein [Candidatus Micrarchaeota archaeon]
MADGDNPCCGGLIAFLIGITLIYGGTQRFLLAQKIKNTPTSKVRSAAVGLVELFGKAKCKDAIDSPISKVRSAYWRVKGEYYKPGKHGGWRDIYNASSSTPFYLEDDTGKMLVEPKEAEIDIPQDFFNNGHLSEGGVFGLFKSKVLDKKVLDFLAATPAANSAFKAHSGFDLRVTEWFIAENDPLYVMGTAEPVKGAVSAIAHENLIVKKGKGVDILYISDSGEKKVVDKVSGSIWWMLGPGFILSAIGLFVLLSSFIQ